MLHFFIVTQQDDFSNCGVFVCEFASIFIKLINSKQIRSIMPIQDLRRVLTKIFSCTIETSQIEDRREMMAKLLHNLSILWDPCYPPPPYIGISNPGHRCYANAVFQCVIRSTPIMKDIARIKSSDRQLSSNFLFEMCADMKCINKETKSYIIHPENKSYDESWNKEEDQGK